jgi:hypothetical protein
MSKVDAAMPSASIAFAWASMSLFQVSMSPVSTTTGGGSLDSGTRR